MIRGSPQTLTRTRIVDHRPSVSTTAQPSPNLPLENLGPALSVCGTGQTYSTPTCNQGYGLREEGGSLLKRRSLAKLPSTVHLPLASSLVTHVEGQGTSQQL
jgi:hypothetical protein